MRSDRSSSRDDVRRLENSTRVGTSGACRVYRGVGALLLGLLLTTDSARSVPYVLKKNDTLWGVAEKFGVTVEAIRQANPKIHDPDLVFAGDRLIIPNPPTLEPAAFDHEIKPGETLGRIAKRYGVAVEALLAANPRILDPDLIFAQEILKVPGSRLPAETALTQRAGNMNAVTHVVEHGDTLAEVAEKYGVTIKEILAANPKIHDPDVLFAGEKLTVVDPPFRAGEAAVAGSIRHEVKPGENLTRIAEHYAVAAQSILAMNPRIRNADLIYSGEILKVPYARLPAGSSLVRRADGRVRVARPSPTTSVGSESLYMLMLLRQASPTLGDRALHDLQRLRSEGKTEQEAYSIALENALKELSRADSTANPLTTWEETLLGRSAKPDPLTDSDYLLKLRSQQRSPYVYDPLSYDFMRQRTNSYETFRGPLRSYEVPRPTVRPRYIARPFR